MFFIYTRVSTVEQASDQKTSLAEQERICRGVAMARGVDKMDIVVYSDPGESGGTPLKVREAGARLLNDMRKGDFVCAAKLDRVFRSAFDALRTAEEFREREVGLILPEFGIEPITTNGTGKFFFGILSLVADFERETIRERVRTGKVGKKARGGHIGGLAPYGFRVVGSGIEAQLVPVEEEQQIIDLVSKLKKRSESLNRIKRRLDEEGLRTRAGKPFHIMQIKRIVDRARPFR